MSFCKRGFTSLMGTFSIMLCKMGLDKHKYRMGFD